MSDPVDLDAYLKRFREGQSIEGFGADVSMTSPCPFCAAPNWMTWPIARVRETMEQGAACAECGRSAKAVFKDSPASIEFELVQTGGPDAPDYLVPKIRRA